MYIPSHFEEPRLEVLHALMHSHPLATLVTVSQDGINANPIPLLLVQEAGPLGVLRGHIARANPLCADLRQGADGLAIFHGPSGYVSPSWYATKPVHGKVVPTWNYAVAQAHGTLRLVDDPVWLRQLLDDLTFKHEAALVRPWALADAPATFTSQLMQAIVGIELEITRLDGKWKLSQNQPDGNRLGVIQGLKDSGGHADLELAAFMEAFAGTP